MNPFQDSSNIGAAVNRTAMIAELLVFANDFVDRSRNWRRQSWETRWLDYQRDADGIYDQEIAKTKAAWQAKIHIPLIPSHRESLKAQLYKTIAGSRPILEMKARGQVSRETDQSGNIRDLILREVEKSRFEVTLDAILDDATTYGSGFGRLRWETVTADRKHRVPVPGPIDPLVAEAMAAQGQLPPAPPIVGYEDQIVEVTTFRGTRFDWVNIWDFYPDPRALKIKGSACAFAYNITYGDVVGGATKGYFFPEAVDTLKYTDDQPGDGKNTGKRAVKANRQLTDARVKTPDYGKPLECYELFARLPKKWVYLNGEEIDDPEKLVPARIIFHRLAILAVEANDQYDGEPPVFKMDYMPVNGRFYGRGIPEMLGGLQDVVNEGVCQRIDTLAIALNKTWALIQQFIVNPEEIGKDAGTMVLVDAKKMREANIDDIRKVVMELPLGNIDRAAYVDPQEMERYAQERTSASKVTLGTAQGKDVNDTARGMELLRSVTNEKLAYIGMFAEFVFLHEVFREYWKVTYANLTPEDLVNALGPERAATFELLSPEQVEQDYRYEPQGIFTQENKAQVQARLGSVRDRYRDQPWLKHEAFFDKELQTIGEDPESYRMSEDELRAMLVSQALIGGAGGTSGPGATGMGGQPAEGGTGQQRPMTGGPDGSP